MKTVEERRDSMEAIAAAMAARTAPQVVSAPLHIAPGNYGDGPLQRRYELHMKMMALNPQGWPQAPGGKPPHRKKARKPAGIAVGWAARLGSEIARRSARPGDEV